MILEHAVLDARPECAVAFERAVNEALPLIAATPGFIDLEVRPCLERPGRYLLLVRWETVEAHEIGFRMSERYQLWKALLHGFYEPIPTVEHYGEAVARA
jgi:heme-degrading monooxygenase HmoA